MIAAISALLLSSRYNIWHDCQRSLRPRNELSGPSLGETLNITQNLPLVLFLYVILLRQIDQVNDGFRRDEQMFVESLDLQHRKSVSNASTRTALSVH
jgi:hypothetical protein